MNGSYLDQWWLGTKERLLPEFPKLVEAVLSCGACGAATDKTV
jgi:hypothetical protein